ncbi:hypothetical protein MAM1_0199d07836 [Mucor ambiguus]|uniref:Uncharacterized protein n=1 Tax=Mucor ambiguus TaxID=91626 RepID=A0A0C9MXN4_9FUNG|nr:hypothetical protein MAM1_0199d07836 [Mucor ambiguus]
MLQKSLHIYYRAARTIQTMLAIETTINVLRHVNIPLNIATNVSFENENEGDAADSRVVDNNNDTNNAVKAKVINGHTEQEATDDVALPPAAKYSEIWIHLKPDFSHQKLFYTFRIAPNNCFYLVLTY